MKRKRRRRTREEIIQELLRTDENFRQLKERIDYYTEKIERERRASS
jgi:hypothetical protein